jgi:hypothetical protein
VLKTLRTIDLFFIRFSYGKVILNCLYRAADFLINLICSVNVLYNILFIILFIDLTFDRRKLLLIIFIKKSYHGFYLNLFDMQNSGIEIANVRFENAETSTYVALVLIDINYSKLKYPHLCTRFIALSIAYRFHLHLFPTSSTFLINVFAMFRLKVLLLVLFSLLN